MSAALSTNYRVSLDHTILVAPDRLERAFRAALAAMPPGMAGKVLEPSGYTLADRALRYRRRRGSQHTVFYRQAAIFYCYQKVGGYGVVSAIGRLFGRDHSTVIHTVKTVGKIMKSTRATAYYDLMLQMDTEYNRR